MHGRPFAVGILAALLLTPGASAHTISLSPRAGDLNTPFRFTGRGWQPRGVVSWEYFTSTRATTPFRSGRFRDGANGRFRFTWSDTALGLTHRMCFTQLDTRFAARQGRRGADASAGARTSTCPAQRALPAVRRSAGRRVRPGRQRVPAGPDASGRRSRARRAAAVGQLLDDDGDPRWLLAGAVRADLRPPRRGGVARAAAATRAPGSTRRRSSSLAAPRGLRVPPAVALSRELDHRTGAGTSAQAPPRHHRSTRTTRPSASSQYRSRSKRMPKVWTARVRGSSSAWSGGRERSARPSRRARNVLATRTITLGIGSERGSRRPHLLPRAREGPARV